MVIVMKETALNKEIKYVTLRAESLGLETHLVQEGKRTLINLLGDLRGLQLEAFSGLPGIETIMSINQPYRLASKDFHPGRSTVNVKDIKVGGGEVVVIAGPCSVESRDQLLKIAHQVKEAGAQMLRGGAFKPRTSPYSFQGLGEDGLKLLAEARRETGLLIVTEVMALEQIPLVSRYADVLQIGARNMQNYPLLFAVGETNLPILLKRGMMCTIQELLMSAEYILSRGNTNVILCERGIRTFETATRNTFDINAIPMLKELSHLPVIADPSHATGISSLVNAVSKGAVAAGADGLIIEVHHDPDNALSDGYQSITPDEFKTLMKEINRVAEAVGRSTHLNQLVREQM
jgi:3-deoxy-7-phosphoheptulonate synthase